MNHPIRILLAKIGLDGHDRGVKLLARSFRDEGIEVIYTGLWQTPAATVHAAMQEDVDIIGVSLHSAAHMTIMPEVIKCQDHYGIRDIPLVLGGIVPQADYQALYDMGVSAVFNPGSAMGDIIQSIRDIAAKREIRNTESLIADCQQGHTKALARLITEIQRSDTAKASIPQDTTRGRVIGITGSPGVGKSSFIAKLAGKIVDSGQRVAVVAVDPTSPITGGALLGDRLRMMSNEPREALFVRSLASANEQGGLGPKIKTIVGLLRAVGYDTILLETVGSGQGDTAIIEVTKNILLLLMPDSGDDIQFSKAGIMEIASGYVINKCDLPGADATHGNLLDSIGDKKPVWRISALHEEGIDALVEWSTSL